MANTHDTIAVIDFGGQYAHLIATKLRRLGVHGVIRDPQDPLDAFAQVKGIILSGSPALASQGEATGYNKAIYDLPVPILGFCFGHQEIVKQYGGRVEHRAREYGPADLHITHGSPILKGLDRVEPVFMSHGDSVVELPRGFVELGYSTLGGGPPHSYAAVADESRLRYGFQFHPEVDDTLHGERMLSNFLFEICACRPSWRMDRFAEEQAEAIRRQVGDRGVFLLASGGVDSTVCAWLLQKALGPERVHLLHIDNGMMRLGESAAVVEAFRSHRVSDHIHFVDASEDFLRAVGSAVDPEKKRLAIGNTFIEVFQRESRRLGMERYLLAQGTIYPDTVETGGTKRADTIKTHHNRVPIIEEMVARGQVVEPLAELYKVEVRELGRALGIPEAFVARHPFPGPGLGVRCLCADRIPSGYDPAAILEAAGPIAARHGLEALPLPIRSVGVKADLRAYDLPLMLWGEDWTFDGATLCAGAIFKEVPALNRCVVSLQKAAPRRAALVPATLTRERLDVLRWADDAVMRGLSRHGLMEVVWQCPTVLVPLRIDEGDGELVVIRPVLSERAMTARVAPLPPKLLGELTRELLDLPGIGSVAYDITTKPPGTIEWE
ncbi:MAG: glutamine-hydrolyzing GMP synthase [Polyangia bacterium]|jgi:GMP synthase (glutamine-hydrolysing)|nr:glutamine-hydrolyzing GMP synthase [Polyangia bacterium]